MCVGFVPFKQPGSSVGTQDFIMQQNVWGVPLAVLRLSRAAKKSRPYLHQQLRGFRAKAARNRRHVALKRDVQHHLRNNNRTGTEQQDNTSLSQPHRKLGE
jgi:hypothetical protein